jgi:hypothetical protein
MLPIRAGDGWFTRQKRLGGVILAAGQLPGADRECQQGEQAGTHSLQTAAIHGLGNPLSCSTKFQGTKSSRQQSNRVLLACQMFVLGSSSIYDCLDALTIPSAGQVPIVVF